jgi:CHAT domain-containing protein
MFVERCSYSISPGVYDLIAFKSKADQQRYRVHHSKESDQKVLFITNPAYPLNGIYQFPDLPGAEQEIMAIKPMVGNFEELKGSHATKEAVLEKFAYSNIIYFAPHGVANPRQMMDSSFLVLSGEKDPYLTAREIMNLRDTTINHDFYRTENKSFPALAILSACQTGLGRSMAAGMTGLARSFLLAGSQQVVMSLWSVDDDATAFLMSRFMNYLLSPLPDYQPAEAMRRAALDTRKNLPNHRNGQVLLFLALLKHWNRGIRENRIGIRWLYFLLGSLAYLLSFFQGRILPSSPNLHGQQNHQCSEAIHRQFFAGNRLYR